MLASEQVNAFATQPLQPAALELQPGAPQLSVIVPSPAALQRSAVDASVQLRNSPAVHDSTSGVHVVLAVHRPVAPQVRSPGQSSFVAQLTVQSGTLVS